MNSKFRKNSIVIALVWFTLAFVTSGWCQGSKEQTAEASGMSASFVNSMELLNESHKLGPGDQLSFRVIEDEDPSRRLSVTDSGEMEVPYLGRVSVTGKTCKALAYEIKTALEKQYYFQASVILGLDVISPKGTVSRGKVYVTGQVRTQGPQEVPSDEVLTVSRVIQRAGGFSDYANKGKVRVTRKSKNGSTETTIVNVLEILEKGKTDKDIVVEPGDQIFVPERGFNFF
jgi:polysaccharide biosynthesis/export protein